MTVFSTVSIPLLKVCFAASETSAGVCGSSPTGVSSYSVLEPVVTLFGAFGTSTTGTTGVILALAGVSVATILGSLLFKSSYSLLYLSRTNLSLVIISSGLV